MNQGNPFNLLTMFIVLKIATEIPPILTKDGEIKFYKINYNKSNYSKKYFDKKLKLHQLKLEQMLC